MADCNETIRELDAFLDGELAPAAQLQIHEHLDGCVDCHQAYDFHAELKAAIQRKCTSDEMPPGLLQRIESCFNTDLDDDGIIGHPDQAGDSASDQASGRPTDLT